MSIWEYCPSKDELVYGSYSTGKCQYCDHELIWTAIKNLKFIQPSDIKFYHKEMMHNMVISHSEIFLEDFEMTDDPEIYDIDLGRCPNCGWWCIDQNIFISTKHQYWNLCFGTSGTLKSFDVSDISAPLEDIRQYLVAKYASRFFIHPQKYEETVGSVFKSLGYNIEVTAYTHDGGVDVILNDPDGKFVGIQVKRYKDTVEVAQIREFLGAIVLGGYTKGIIVTTSSFQSGAKRTALEASKIGFPIELIDGDNFLHMLKIAQVHDFENYPNFLERDGINEIRPTIWNEYHMNSQ
jgi:restriction system protein